MQKIETLILRQEDLNRNAVKIGDLKEVIFELEINHFTKEAFDAYLEADKVIFVHGDVKKVLKDRYGTT